MSYRSPDWQLQAACAGLGVGAEAFFPDKGGSSTAAKKVCAACDVRTECLSYALAEGLRYGIFGGLSAHQRRRLGRQHDIAA
jgi:WhiB family redox-sensing transcriptional regulator